MLKITCGDCCQTASRAGAFLESVEAIGNLLQMSTMSLASLDAFHGDLSSHDELTQPSTEVQGGQTLGVLLLHV